MDMIKDIHWLGHDTFRIQSGGKVLYTDPFKIEGSAPDKKADLVLITHEHYDHCSPEDVQKIAKDGTVIVCPADCVGKFPAKIKTMGVKPGDRVEVAGIGVEAVPAYNTNKKFHPREKQWVGYIFTVEGKRIYIAGDTDYIPEMRDFKADIALLPVSGTYVMTAEEAARAALDMKPGIVIPMHYGSIVGTREDAARFKEILEGKVNVAILNREG
ncbi:MAG: MBL fold metallo-hydrolase [Nitrospiraceae bacterium]|nr:MBL fold metallo-hydrolase [Nitrospiraceae bacterium]